jgi:hypothetical protein
MQFLKFTLFHSLHNYMRLISKFELNASHLKLGGRDCIMLDIKTSLKNIIQN